MHLYALFTNLTSISFSFFSLIFSCFKRIKVTEISHLEDHVLTDMVGQIKMDYLFLFQLFRSNYGKMTPLKMQNNI